MNLSEYFERVVLINLKRRPERLARVKKALQHCQWPFKQPEVFEAVDGLSTPCPPHFVDGVGAWGCLQSHYQILSKARADKVRNILVLEDDICFVDNFRSAVGDFLSAVPKNWDQLMLGGQHKNFNGEPTRVKPGILRCTDCERTHCYAIRGEFMQKLCDRWQGGGKFNGSRHCDWIMGRDPEMQFAHKVYSPEFFLVGQDRDDKSDITGTGLPRKFWNPPPPDRIVVNLHAPANVISELRFYGLCTGDGLHNQGDLGDKLVQIFKKTRKNPPERQRLLRNWITILQWELAAESAMICTVCHPEATAELVQATSLWPVYEITADSVKDALAQLPANVRKICQRRRTSTMFRLQPWPSAARLPGQAQVG